MADEQALVQKQFGTHAEQYVRSRDHAAGESLDRLLEVLALPPTARALDIATGGGHAALALARRGHPVVASDLTLRMLAAARRFLAEQEQAQVMFAQADAQGLPWGADAFDLVTCRIAPHHFPDVGRFVRECARVVRRGGQVALIDNATPADPAAARYINAFEKLRDPSHHWEYSAAEWEHFFEAAGLQVGLVEEFRKPIRFQPWCERMGVRAQTRQQLRVLLQQAPAAARAALNPREENGHLTFDLGEVLIVGRAP